MSRRLYQDFALFSARNALTACLHASFFAVLLTAGCSEDGNNGNGADTGSSTSDTSTSSNATATGSSSTPATTTGATGTTSGGQGTTTTTATVAPTPSGSATSTGATASTSGGSGGSSSASNGSTGAASSGGSGASGTSDSGSTSDGSQGESSSASSDTDGEQSSSGETSDPGFQPCPTNGDPCKILPLGDSITEGFGFTGNAGGYRVQLFREANENGKTVTFVGTQQNGPNDVDGTPFPKNHQGHGGYTITGNMGISGNITNNALTMFSPHIVLLMIGTNDLNGNIDPDNAPNRLGTLMDDIITRAPDALLAVASIIPMTNGNGNKVEPYNNKIPDLVAARAEQGKHVIFVDNWAAFTANQNYGQQWMGDPLHPNVEGYNVLGSSFYEAIASYLP